MALIEGSDHGDLLKGTAGGDTMYGYGGDDLLFGGGGADRLYGGLGNDVLCGGGGADTVRGGAGDDRLVLSFGNDRLDGGAGSDTLVLNLHLDAGPPETPFSPPPAAIEIHLGSEAIFLVGDESRVKLSHIENVRTGDGTEYVYGTEGANRISVGHGANFADGAGGNDTIYGSNVHLEDRPDDDPDRFESIDGGNGNDLIVGASRAWGGEGNDTLVSGWFYGQEMNGNDGADRFVFSDRYTLDRSHGDVWHDQHATIRDFRPETGDRIVIDRGDDDAPAPVFAGTVEKDTDLHAGQYGFIGTNRLVYVAHEGHDPIYDYDYVIGPHIDFGDFYEGRLRASDVLFV